MLKSTLKNYQKKGQCLTKYDFDNVERWNFYQKKLSKLKSLLMDVYEKRDAKLSDKISPFSIARNETLAYMQNLMDYICDIANVQKYRIDKRDILCAEFYFS